MEWTYFPQTQFKLSHVCLMFLVAQVGHPMFTIAIPTLGGGTCQLPFEAMAATSYCGIQRRNDVARAFKLDPRTVTRQRNLVAKSDMWGDNQFADNLSDKWEKQGPAAFATIIAPVVCRCTLLPEIVSNEAKGVGT